MVRQTIGTSEKWRGPRRSSMQRESSREHRTESPGECREYKPGSALFVVWQQGRQDDGDRGDLRFGRDFGGLFAAPSRNVFLVKFSYWLNY